ncbi:1-acylglycerol-3-phosphate O-acyltransferase [Gracilibacillus halophilus YIM-C55.5]|uniref:1-acylglycerol-3-phosphate O-acyltransferase n=1 Tax=Gracilibacillus halophilus YIM-C55.5 TaxID=1308866 RepID=N4WDM0_9BACI|nr:lysophospholipid acyltransferase family protein [Gracilibacillus halophilus]ENH97354.1 1-acylglycerol-3-phosphate O-acyltransferase [Gracilibacillus halophilus YIM-C55.5]
MSLYKFAKFVVKMILKPLYRVKKIGTENIPTEGPVIICSNHISNFDPPIVGITCPRVVHFLAKEELFQKKFFGTLLKKLNAFPIKRGMKDKNALRQGLGILKEGETLGLFPEGTRSKTGEIKKGLSGAGFFALRSKATVVPCAIIGNYKGKQPLRVVYGKPVDLETLRKEKASAQEVTDKIMNDIKKIKENYEVSNL